MTNEESAAIANEIAAKMNRVAELMATKKTRDLSRREKAELATIEAETKTLRDRLPAGPDPRLFQHNAPLVDDDDRSNGLLRSDESVADWMRGRDGYRSRSYDGHDDRDLSLGKMVRGAVTGRWDDAEAEQRALVEGTLADGGYLLAPLLSGRIIDRIRNNARVVQAGAVTVPMEQPTVWIPRLVGGADVGLAWKSEGNPIGDSTPTFDRVTLTAQTLPCLVKLSVELFEDLSPAASDAIENELAKTIALEVDRACLRGSGIAPEPTGILHQSGVTVTPLGTGNGDTLNWDDVIMGVSRRRAANVEPNAVLWSARSQETIDLVKDSMGRYLQPPPSLDNVQRLVTNQIPNNLHVGTSTDASEVYIGRWSDLLIGVRTEMQLRLLSERFIDNYEYALLAVIRADVAVAHGEAFEVLTGVLP